MAPQYPQEKGLFPSMPQGASRSYLVPLPLSILTSNSSLLCFCFPFTDPDLWISWSLTLLFLNVSSPLSPACLQFPGLQGSVSPAPGNLGALGKGLWDERGWRRQEAGNRSLLCHHSSSQKPGGLVHLYKGTGPELLLPTLYVTATCPETSQAGREHLGLLGAAHIVSSEGRVVWGCLCCSSLPTAMVPEQQRCFSGLHIYFNLNSCVYVRRFPCFSWEALIG